MLCRALGRTDLVDKYHVALATHDGGVSKQAGATTTPTPRETTIKALPDETVATIQRLCKDKHAQFMSVTNKVPVTFFDTYDTQTPPERKQTRSQIKELCEHAIDYLLLAFMYEDMQPTRNELANIRFYSPGLPVDGVAHVSLADGACVLRIPKTKKMGRELTIQLTDTPIHAFLSAWQPYAQALQEQYLETHGDGLINSPFLVCAYDHTKCYYCVDEQKDSKTPVGKTPHTGLANRRPRVFKEAGIVGPKGHVGCIAARHSRTTADAAANAGLPPKERVATQKRQARERDHSAATAAAVYEDPAPRRKKKRHATITIEEV
jgi:hypothetical protein